MELIAADDGTRLRTWTTGRSGTLPPVVLLHGGPGLWDYLAPVAALLDPLTVVHRFDQRGCGGSDPSDEHTVARLVAGLDGLRAHWGHDTWVVIGHSFGATLAFGYAVAHPARTAGLGYVSGTGVGDWRTAYRQNRDRRMTAAQRARRAELSGLHTRRPDEEVELRALSWFADHADPSAGWDLAVARASTLTSVSWEANRRLVAEVDRWDASDVLRRARGLRAPTCFVHGEEDPRPHGTVQALARAVPVSTSHLIPGAGHEPWVERPNEVGRRLRALAVRAGGQNRPPGAGH